MNWVSTVWGILIGGCMAMALPQLLIGIWQRNGARLFFVLAAGAVIAIASGELMMMRASSIDYFAQAMRWTTVPIFILAAAMIGFVQLYLKTGRLWLGLGGCGLSLVYVVLNFAFDPNVTFLAITELRHLHFLGETVSVPIGLIRPWRYLADLANVVLLTYVIDASVSLWRRGKAENRRRAVIVGGGITFFILVATSLKILTNLHILAVPYVVSFCFAAILVAMAFEMGYDLFAATQIARELQRSESSLSESEARFRTMADAAPVLIWMSGPDKLCTFFNKAWMDFTGRTMEQEVGDGWTEGVHPDDFDKCLSTYLTAFDGRKPFAMQYRLRHYDGEYRSVTDNGVPRYGPAGSFRGYIGACVDVTDLLKQEQALHQSEERVALAADAAHLGVWELDTKTNNLWMSDKARELFQFDSEVPVTYAELQDRVHVEDRTARDLAMKRAIETQGGYEIEYRVLLPDGTVRWIAGRARRVRDEDGELTRLLGVSMDVTERKEAQELFQLATDASPSGTLLVNDQAQIILVNAHIEELFGYERDELIGKPIEMLVPERFRRQHPAHRAKFLAAPQARVMGAGRDLFALRKDRTEFPVEIGLNPVRTPRGTLVLATVVDVSPRKRAEEEARRQREQIDLLSRVSLLGEMTASLAHELNQPLSAVVSNANAGVRFIDKGKVELGVLREILVDVATAGHRAHDIVSSVRNTIKKGSAIRQRI
ncbi:MAG TPA: PAS domain S-box protein, partial [Chthoniobacterales bacterium]|nr:PAS domain S-box protein [Chthoniobacterales bacterium]